MPQYTSTIAAATGTQTVLTTKDLEYSEAQHVKENGAKAKMHSVGEGQYEIKSRKRGSE